MSYYRFFASDQEMPEFDNGKAQPVTVDGEVVAIRFADRFGEDTAMRIVKEDDCYYARKFTDKKYVNYLEWYYDDHNAQLIFNTHNPIFLNSNLFRRDEIKFVERDDDSHQSILYALSDFGTTGDKGVRKHEDYMGKYFISQYGAIKDIDFTPIFEEILDREGEV